MSHTRCKGKIRERLTSDPKRFSGGRSMQPPAPGPGATARVNMACPTLAGTTQEHSQAPSPGQHWDGPNPPAPRSTIRWASPRATPPLGTAASPTSHEEPGVRLRASTTEGPPKPCRSPARHLVAQQQLMSLLLHFHSYEV